MQIIKCIVIGVSIPLLTSCGVGGYSAETTNDTLPNEVRSSNPEITAEDYDEEVTEMVDEVTDTVLSAVTDVKDDFDEYVGKIGEYDVIMRLKVHGVSEPDMMPTFLDVSGSYTYTKAGNTLQLSGEMQRWPGVGGNPDANYPLYFMEEVTPKGKVSGEWELETTRLGLKGTMKLTKNGDVFNVNLRRK